MSLYGSSKLRKDQPRIRHPCSRTFGGKKKNYNQIGRLIFLARSNCSQNIFLLLSWSQVSRACTFWIQLHPWGLTTTDIELNLLLTWSTSKSFWKLVASSDRKVEWNANTKCSVSLYKSEVYWCIMHGLIVFSVSIIEVLWTTI